MAEDEDSPKLNPYIPMPLVTYHIHIDGIVQGVGFRPFVYNLAQDSGLKGWVRNSANGVDIEVSGPENQIKTFINTIKTTPPPLSHIDSIGVEKMPVQDFKKFEIIQSKNKAGDFIPISPDVATCSACQEELFSPTDRRYRYPFINCTNCGPRFTIIKDIPYDRPKTTMKTFEMCPACLKEYENPGDRRFHAQPIACTDCGPHIWLEDREGNNLASRETALQQARERLAQGQILAIKGLGGFHLACNAADQIAVQNLRKRKRRPAKPFALMSFNIEIIRKYAHLSKEAEALLKSPQAPIVLLDKKTGTKMAEAVAPGQSRLGFMLPYTPLHHLLLAPENHFPEILVMTSGNISEAPVIHTNSAARKKLNGIADAFLMHDRPIHIRIDDSVFSMINSKPYPIRRARGYAPNPIRTKRHLPQVLAVGPQMKNTFCLTRDKYAFVSHHIGEMDNWETFQDYQKAVEHYQNLFRITPEIIACDAHPNYISSEYAHTKAHQEGLPLVTIQHHHAHLAATMSENGLPPDEKVIGLIFDGTGYGLDRNIWGGEVLIGNCLDFERIFHLQNMPLPGGDISIQKPARMALSALWHYGLPWEEDLAPVQYLSELEQKTLRHQLNQNINTTPTSSMGRLFDAVSALIGIRQVVSYEAQAAIELETLAAPDETGMYPFEIVGEEINVKQLLKSILIDLQQHQPKAIIAARFHHTIARLSLTVCENIRENQGLDQVILSGGVWQNRILLEETIKLLNKHDFKPYIHHQLPPNDGCIAFGQGMIAAYRYTQKEV